MASSTAGAPRKALFMVTIKDIADIANARTPHAVGRQPLRGLLGRGALDRGERKLPPDQCGQPAGWPGFRVPLLSDDDRLRKEQPVIVCGHYELLDADNEAVFTYTREYEGKKLLCVCNFTGENQTVELPEEFRTGAAKRLIGNYPEQETPGRAAPLGGSGAADRGITERFTLFKKPCAGPKTAHGFPCLPPGQGTKENMKNPLDGASPA